MRQRMMVLLLVFICLPIFALALGPVASTSERSAPATFRVETGGTTVLVDAYLASLREGESYLPLHVAIGVGGRGARLLLTRESFSIVDAQGAVYPLATYEEIAQDYRKASFDRKLLELHPMAVGNVFSTSSVISSFFFPALADRALRVDRVDLGRFTWFHDLLYFPRPLIVPGSILTLRIEGAGEDRALEVKFCVPE